jgi:hypothetical protein
MRNGHEIDSEGAAGAKAMRAIVASLCVLGLASLMWVHSGSVGPVEERSPSIGGTPAAAEQSSLRAPTTDASLPSLESVMTSQRDVPADAAQAPTF